MTTVVVSRPRSLLDDRVSRLRRWGSEEIHALDPVCRYLVGGGADCEIRIEHPTVSRRHAVLTFERGAWWARDRDSTNGIEQDGERRVAVELAPLVELGLGDVKLVAESALSIAMYELLQRWLGWSDAKRIERAVAAVRDWVARRAALVVVGAPDARPFVRAVGQLVFDDDAEPLSVDDLARTEDRATAICVSTVRELLAVHRHCSRIATIAIPALSQRDTELDRLYQTAIDQALLDLDADPAALRQRDLVWLRSRNCASLSQLDDVARRLVAIRAWGVTHGAARLGISHGALSRWAVRHRLAT